MNYQEQETFNNQFEEAINPNRSWRLKLQSLWRHLRILIRGNPINNAIDKITHNRMTLDDLVKVIEKNKAYLNDPSVTMPLRYAIDLEGIGTSKIQIITALLNNGADMWHLSSEKQFRDNTEGKKHCPMIHYMIGRKQYQEVIALLDGDVDHRITYDKTRITSDVGKDIDLLQDIQKVLKPKVVKPTQNKIIQFIDLVNSGHATIETLRSVINRNQDCLNTPGPDSPLLHAAKLNGGRGNAEITEMLGNWGAKLQRGEKKIFDALSAAEETPESSAVVSHTDKPAKPASTTGKRVSFASQFEQQRISRNQESGEIDKTVEKVDPNKSFDKGGE